MEAPLFRFEGLTHYLSVVTRCLFCFCSFLQVEVIKKLIDCGVKKDQIVVLSPYRAQCYIIGEDLAKQQLSEIPVMSIVKSQGRMKCIKCSYQGSLLYRWVRTRVDKGMRQHTYILKSKKGTECKRTAGHAWTNDESLPKAKILSKSNHGDKKVTSTVVIDNLYFSALMIAVLFSLNVNS